MEWSRVVVHLDTDRKQKILTFNAFNWRLMDLILLFISSYIEPPLESLRVALFGLVSARDMSTVLMSIVVRFVELHRRPFKRSRRGNLVIATE